MKFWLGVCLWAFTVALVAGEARWNVSVSPQPVSPGMVLVCRLDGRAPEGLILAGFHQEAGFYHSGGLSVALLAVPLNAKAGLRSLNLRFKSHRQKLPVRVAKDPYPHKHVRAVPHLKSKLAAPQAADERESLLHAEGKSLGPPQWSGPFLWPLNPPIIVTSPYGAKRSYNHGQAAWQHLGLDLRASHGTPVLACADGVVLLARKGLALTGGTILLGHGYGVTSAYFHLSHISVKAGQRIHAGEPVGASGASGIANGPHLHWQVNLRGKPTDPRQWLDPVVAQTAQPAH